MDSLGKYLQGEEAMTEQYFLGDMNETKQLQIYMLFRTLHYILLHILLSFPSPTQLASKTVCCV